jgi:hypothetical protein
MAEKDRAEAALRAAKEEASKGGPKPETCARSIRLIRSDMEDCERVLRLSRGNESASKDDLTRLEQKLNDKRQQVAS